MNINEDASARGLTRSSIPNDARLTLTSQLGAALNQGLGQLGLQQANQVGDIQSKIASLGVTKAKDIADLANMLRTSDLEQQKFEYQKQKDLRDLELAKQELAIKRAASAAVDRGAPAGLVNGIFNTLNNKRGKDGFVSPETFRSGLQQWVTSGGAPSSYYETFGAYVNPVHQERFGGYY